MSQPLYLDYGATTPLDPAVAAAMEPWGIAGYGNPHSAHLWGYQAKAAVELARDAVAALINAPPETIAFTSGATESNNWALKGFPSVRIVISAIESPSVAKSAAAAPLCTLKVVPVDSFGQVRMDDLEKTLNEGPVKLVSIKSAITAAHASRVHHNHLALRNSKHVIKSTVARWK